MYSNNEGILRPFSRENNGSFTNVEHKIVDTEDAQKVHQQILNNGYDNRSSNGMPYNAVVCYL